MNYHSTMNAEVSGRIIKNVFFRVHLASLQVVKFELEIVIQKGQKYSVETSY